MRQLTGLIGLALLAALLSGSALSLGAGRQGAPGGLGWSAVQLYAQQAEGANYEQELLQAAEELFAEKGGELRREQAQKLHDAAAALREELQARAAAEQQDLNKELLGLQLELLFVSLAPQEEEEKLLELAAVQEELRDLQDQLEAEYKERMEELQTIHEAELGRRLAALEVELFQAVQEELALYRLALSRAQANGSY
ncbi:MAG TPA: hypothetical protein PLM25_04960 [Limnochordia bacterium]|nr:hypothetical protein [Limnochordia bacterium]